jgi:hypothetical protein
MFPTMPFQSPDNANTLISSSPLVVSLRDEAMRLPGEASHDNYDQIGITKGSGESVALRLRTSMVGSRVGLLLIRSRSIMPTYELWGYGGNFCAGAAFLRAEEAA